MTENAIALIEVVESGLASRDEFMSALNAVKVMKEKVKALDQRMTAAAIEFVKEYGTFDDGDFIYAVGKAKTTKCTDLRATVEAVLNKTAGDVDAFTLCLSTSAFKPAFTRKLLGDDAAPLFVDEEKDKLEFKQINKRFVKNTAGSEDSE